MGQLVSHFCAVINIRIDFSICISCCVYLTLFIIIFCCYNNVTVQNRILCSVSYENFTYEPGVSLIAGLDSPCTGTCDHQSYA